MLRSMNAVCIFCGSNAGTNPAYAQAARETGALLAQRGLTLVYGGGSIGLMGLSADAVLAAGGQVRGVIPDFLDKREVGHKRIQEQIVVGSMHERKQRMADLSDGFLALPGGMGTLDELCEIITWSQLGLHRKPIALLNVAGYFDSFLQFMDRGVAEGFIPPLTRASMLVDSEPARLLDRMEAYQGPELPPILRPGQT
jgi:hypothetical protein